MVTNSAGRQRSFQLPRMFINFSMDLAAAATWTGIQNIPWHLALHPVTLIPGWAPVPALLAAVLLIEAVVCSIVAGIVAWIIMKYTGVFMVGGARAALDYHRTNADYRRRNAQRKTRPA